MRESFFVDIREKAADTGNVCTKSVCLKGRAKRDEGGITGGSGGGSVPQKRLSLHGSRMSRSESEYAPCVKAA